MVACHSCGVLSSLISLGHFLYEIVSEFQDCRTVFLQKVKLFSLRSELDWFLGLASGLRIVFADQ